MHPSLLEQLAPPQLFVEQLQLLVQRSFPFHENAWLTHMLR